MTAVPAATKRDDDSIDWSANFMLMSSEDSEEGYLVPKAAAKMSALVTGLIDADEQITIAVKNLANATVQSIAWYLAHWGENPDAEPLTNKLPSPFPNDHYTPEQLTPFEFHYAETLFPKVGTRNMKVLTGLLHGAHFLQIQTLIDLAGCALTFHFRGKDVVYVEELMKDQVPEYTKDPPADDDEEQRKPVRPTDE